MQVAHVDFMFGQELLHGLLVLLPLLLFLLLQYGLSTAESGITSLTAWFSSAPPRLLCLFHTPPVGLLQLCTQRRHPNLQLGFLLHQFLLQYPSLLRLRRLLLHPRRQLAQHLLLKHSRAQLSQKAGTKKGMCKIIELQIWDQTLTDRFGWTFSEDLRVTDRFSDAISSVTIS